MNELTSATVIIRNLSVRHPAPILKKTYNFGTQLMPRQSSVIGYLSIRGVKC